MEDDPEMSTGKAGCKTGERGRGRRQFKGQAQVKKTFREDVWR